ncbi:hypothetical protein [Paenibacillus elgii]|uniref:hypothetical protein n=1 Tax=Paenibacillus elgii TaxID=189691 RepID=UPI0013D4084B|nr:hypothetical protein [Paenibacillus elgii]
MTDFRISGLEEHIRQMERAARDRKRYDELRYEVGKANLDNNAKLCGEKSGRLVASFRRQSYKGKKEWILFVNPVDTVEVGTKVFYARMVENGHKLKVPYGRPTRIVRSGVDKGKRRRRVKTKGFVPGKHFMRRALEKTNEQIPGMVDSFLKKIGKEAGFDVT